MIKDDFAKELGWAAENVKDHIVQVVCAQRNDNGDFLAGIYRCMKPNGCSSYGFDIAISRFGMAVYGDIGELIFKVGTSYGTEFLARKSVDGYYISKLADEFRNKKELNETKLKMVCLEAGAALIVEHADWTFDDDELPFDDTPEWVVEASQGTLDNLLSREGELRDLIAKLAPHHTHMRFETFNNAFDELMDEKAPNGLQAVENYLSDNWKELYLSQEWYEHDIRQYDGGLIQRLEMVRLMAIKIEEMERGTH